MGAESFFGMGGLTPESIEAFFKGTGILGAVGILAFLMIKHKVVRLVSVNSGSEWIRAKWGVEQYHRFGKKHGRLVRLKSGRHLLLRGMYDGWEICLQEIPVVKLELEQPFHGYTLKFDSLTIGYQVIAPDTPEGDKLMLRSFLSVRNLDRDNQKSESLDDKVLGIITRGLGKHLKRAKHDKYGLPILSERAWMRIVQRRLRKKHGVKVTSLEWSEPTWSIGQQQYNGLRMVALALGYTPEMEIEEDKTPPVDRAEVIDLATHTHMA